MKVRADRKNDGVISVRCERTGLPLGAFVLHSERCWLRLYRGSPETVDRRKEEGAIETDGQKDDGREVKSSKEPISDELCNAST